MGSRSDFLFARPSFTEGVARLFDFGNGLDEYNRSESETQADIRALRNDWYAIGDDLRAAMSKHAEEEELEVSYPPGTAEQSR